jgi:hypothetical protein
MQGSTTDRTSTASLVVHPLDPEDAAITAAIRPMVSSTKGARPGIEAPQPCAADPCRATPPGRETMDHAGRCVGSFRCDRIFARLCN